MTFSIYKVLSIDALMAVDWRGPLSERVDFDYWLENRRLDMSLERWRRIIHGC